MNAETKPWYASKGVVGGIVAVAAGGAALFGYSISPADQASLVELAAGLASAIGGVLAVWGRISATRTIG